MAPDEQTVISCTTADPYRNLPSEAYRTRPPLITEQIVREVRPVQEDVGVAGTELIRIPDPQHAARA